MRRKSQPLISIQEVEHYLIYHCPLEANTTYGVRRDEYPFEVHFYYPNQNFRAVGATPWSCYAVLTELIYRDLDALVYITDQYRKS